MEGCIDSQAQPRCHDDVTGPSASPSCARTAAAHLIFVFERINSLPQRMSTHGNSIIIRDECLISRMKIRKHVKHGQAAALALLQFCLLFGAGGGEGAADCISQPEPSVPCGHGHGRQVAYAALRWSGSRHTPRNDAPQPGDRAIGRNHGRPSGMAERRQNC